MESHVHPRYDPAIHTTDCRSHSPRHPPKDLLQQGFWAYEAHAERAEYVGLQLPVCLGWIVVR